MAEAAPDGKAQDARVLDARALDASLPNAPDGAPQPESADGATQDAAAHDAAVASDDTPTRSWRDVAAGPAPTPRELCTRTWQIPQRPIINGFGLNPIVRFVEGAILSDGDDTLVAGWLSEPFDFGTGLLTVPTSQAFVLALDGACNLLWVRTFAPASGRNARIAMALGLDAQRHPVLVTASSKDSADFSVELVTLDASGNVLAEVAQAIGEPPPGSAFASRDGRVLFTGTSYRALDYGAGVIEPGYQYNVLLDADGTPRHQKLIGTSNKVLRVGQGIGRDGELIAWGSDLADYYGASFDGFTIAKVAPSTGALVWKQELYPKEPITLEDMRQDVGEDGSIAAWTLHGYDKEPGAEQHVRELGPDGTQRWAVPISRDGSFFLHGVRMGKASIAAYGAITEATRIGNTQLRVEAAGQRQLVMQVDRGGALRWSVTFAKAEYVEALDVLARGDVVVAGYDITGGPGGTLPTFVRIYGRGE